MKNWREITWWQSSCVYEPNFTICKIPPQPFMAAKIKSTKHCRTCSHCCLTRSLFMPHYMALMLQYAYSNAQHSQKWTVWGSSMPHAFGRPSPSIHQSKQIPLPAKSTYKPREIHPFQF